MVTIIVPLDTDIQKDQYVMSLVTSESGRGFESYPCDTRSEGTNDILNVLSAVFGVL